jgi:hypothetical protein
VALIPSDTRQGTVLNKVYVVLPSLLQPATTGNEVLKINNVFQAMFNLAEFSIVAEFSGISVNILVTTPAVYSSIHDQ